MASTEAVAAAIDAFGEVFGERRKPGDEGFRRWASALESVTDAELERAVAAICGERTSVEGWPTPGDVRARAASLRPPREHRRVPGPALVALDGGDIPLGAFSLFGLATCTACDGTGVRWTPPTPARPPDVSCGPRPGWRCGCRVPLREAAQGGSIRA